jgi:hypothetical protein
MPYRLYKIRSVKSFLAAKLAIFKAPAIGHSERRPGQSENALPSLTAIIAVDL